MKWPYGEFEIPNEVYDAFGAAGKKGQALEDEWNKVHGFLLNLHMHASNPQQATVQQHDHCASYNQILSQHTDTK